MCIPGEGQGMRLKWNYKDNTRAIYIGTVPCNKGLKEAMLSLFVMHNEKLGMNMSRA